MLLRVLLVVLKFSVYYDEVCGGKVTFNETFFEIMKNQTNVMFEDSYETDVDGNIVTITYPYHINTTVHYYGPRNYFKIPARGSVRHVSGNDTDQDLEPACDIDLLRFYSQRFCAFAHRVHLILYANNISHDTVYVNTQNKPKWFIDSYFPPKIPMIVENQIPITDSLLICDYLNVKYPGPRPLCHEDAFYQNDDNVMLAEEFETVAWTLRDCLMRDTMTNREYSNLTNALKYFERELDKRGTIYWFGNEYPGMTDYMMWPWFERIATIPVHSKYVFPNPLSELPRLLKWEQHMMIDGAVRAYHQTPEVYCEYFRRRRKRLPLFDPPI